MSTFPNQGLSPDLPWDAVVETNAAFRREPGHFSARPSSPGLGEQPRVPGLKPATNRIAESGFLYRFAGRH